MAMAWRDVPRSLGYAGGARATGHELGKRLSYRRRAFGMFDRPSAERLTAAMGLLGIDPASLSEDAGHA